VFIRQQIMAQTMSNPRRLRHDEQEGDQPGSVGDPG
jgi:hypothetical protein